MLKWEPMGLLKKDFRKDCIRRREVVFSAEGMRAVTEFFLTLSDLERGALLIGGLGLFLGWESWRPLQRFGGNRWGHMGLNLVFLGLSILIHLALAWVVVSASAWAVRHQFGLMQWVRLPGLVEVVVSLLLLELIAAWVPHWMMHRVPVLWRWHLVHHSDTRVDATTGLRTHPYDVLIRLASEAVAVLVIGVSLWMVVLYETLVTIATLFAHANVALPVWLNRSLNWLFVTPNFHRVHHHFEQPHTDNNYGLVFSVWDRLFRTCIEVRDPRVLEMGLDSHLRPDQHSRLKYLLVSPLQPAANEVEIRRDPGLTSHERDRGAVGSS